MKASLRIYQDDFDIKLVVLWIHTSFKLSSPPSLSIAHRYHCRVTWRSYLILKEAKHEWQLGNTKTRVFCGGSSDRKVFIASCPASFFGLISSFGGLFLTSKSSSDYKSYHDGQWVRPRSHILASQLVERLGRGQTDYWSYYPYIIPTAGTP